MIRMGWLRRRERERTVVIHEYVTGGGLAGQDLPESWAAEGCAMRRAVARDFAAVRGVKVVVTLDARFRGEPGPWEIVRIGPGEERATLTRLARAAHATLPIAPETDGLLYQRVQWIQWARGRALASAAGGLVFAGGSTEGPLLVAASKHLLADVLLSAGVRTPPVLYGLPPYFAGHGFEKFNRRAIRRDERLDPEWGDWRREEAGDEIAPGCPATTRAERAALRETNWATLRRPRYPVVVKPIDGAGSVDTHLIPDPEALAEFLAAREPDGPAKVRYLEERPDALRQSHYWYGWGRLGVVLVQPYVPGDPMSASFLVDRRGRGHLVGIGRQDVEIRDGRFHYRGGTLPSGAPGLADEPRRALAAVPGLRGWVGVDFIREPDGRVTVLEINPRLTTSFVGLAKLLPPGTLAAAMLDAFDHPRRLDRRDLAAAVHAQSPLTFRADGSILGVGSTR
jgi:predicted ATP-grasp superfamily ATP-dependent carboligase